MTFDADLQRVKLDLERAKLKVQEKRLELLEIHIKYAKMKEETIRATTSNGI